MSGTPKKSSSPASDLITQTEALESLCRQWAETPYITVDTEFMRESTYWPKLCVVQVAGGEDGPAAAIDALDRNLSLAPLFAIFADPKITKVFHAGRQDMEIFYHLTGRLPAPVFDTQVAAMVCGFGDQASYETLAAKLANAKIDKSSRFTDWSRRPLTKRQTDYALADVTHLRMVYEKLSKRLGTNGRAEWLAGEMDILTSPATYDMPPEEAFRRVKIRSKDRRFLAVMRSLAAWREEEAQRMDIPRGRVVRDEALMEIAHHTPATADDLARTRGLGKRFATGPQGQAVLGAVKRGLAVADEDCPKPRLKEELPRGIGPVIDLLRVLLKMKCDETGVAQKLLASANDLEKIAAFGDRADVRALRGWRREVFGEDALKLRCGGLAMAVKDKRLIVLET